MLLHHNGHGGGVILNQLIPAVVNPHPDAEQLARQGIAPVYPVDELHFELIRDEGDFAIDGNFAQFLVAIDLVNSAHGIPRIDNVLNH